jgi:hypothetical protein
MQIILTEDEYDKLKNPKVAETNKALEFFTDEMNKLFKKYRIDGATLGHHLEFNAFISDVGLIMNHIRESQKT